jgi:hypothetical protein
VHGGAPNVIEKSKTFLPLERGSIVPVNEQPNDVLPAIPPFNAIAIVAFSPFRLELDHEPEIDEIFAGMR